MTTDLRAIDCTLPNELWTTQQVGEYCGVRSAAVRVWRKDGLLQAVGRRPGPRGAWLFDPNTVVTFLTSTLKNNGELIGDVEALINAEVNRVCQGRRL